MIVAEYKLFRAIQRATFEQQQKILMFIISHYDTNKTLVQQNHRLTIVLFLVSGQYYVNLFDRTTVVF